MEIHIKANLDDNGQLQSVSSSCAQAPGGFSPFSIPLPVDGVEVRESKVVNYAVKKDLCNKLDAKVTEISQLILEYQKTKQTLDLALKLNNEFAEKIKRHEKTIEQLQKANNSLTKLLEEHNIPIPETTSSCNIHSLSAVPDTASPGTETMAENIGEQATVFRSSTTELKFEHRLSSISMTDSLYSKPTRSRDADDEKNQSESNPGNNKDNNKGHNSQFSRILVSSYSETSRPRKLPIPTAYSPSCSDNCRPTRGTSSDDELNSPADQFQSTPTGNDGIVDDPSCTDRADCGHDTPDKGITQEGLDTVDGPPGALGHGEESTDDASNGNVKAHPCSTFDENGYLILMVPTDSAIMRGKITKWNPESGDSKPQMELVTDRCCCCSQSDNDVHVTWLEFHKCLKRHGFAPSNLNGSRDQQDALRHDSSCGSACSSTASVDVGPQRREKRQPEHVMEPFRPRSNAIHRKGTSVGYVEIPDDDVFDNKEAYQRDSDSKKYDRYSSRSPAPLPRSSYGRGNSDSSPDSEFGHRRNGGLSPQRCRTEDKPNNVMKMMRKTSEWHSAKRLLLEKSHTRTSMDAETTLSLVVQETLDSFKTEMEGKQRRASNNAPDKLIRMVQQSLFNKCDDEVLTTEFLEKCIQLCEREFS